MASSYLRLSVRQILTAFLSSLFSCFASISLLRRVSPHLPAAGASTGGCFRPACLVDLLYDYLAPRKAVVSVQGADSDPITIVDEVFQGTVLGPCLWNVFFCSDGRADPENDIQGCQVR